MERILIANRGEIARRLIRHFRAAGVETVAAFSEPDVEQPFVEEADYPVYLNGRTVDETYNNPLRVLSAAMDSGCDAVHPGYCFLAERSDFYDMALAANLPVVGDRLTLAKTSDRIALRHAAEGVGIPLIPATPPLTEDAQVDVVAAQLGYPAFVKAVAGGARRRIAGPAGLDAAVVAMREEARRASGIPDVYLERAVDRFREIGTVVVGDRHGTCVALGELDGSLQVGFHTWVEEMGDALVPPELRARIEASSVALARAIGFVGVGRVRWAVTATGGWFLLGFSARLTTGYSLVEAVHGVNLVEIQLESLQGAPLGWSGADLAPKAHGVQVRIVHVDPSDLSRPEGVVERLEVPSGVVIEAGTAEGQICSDLTDPLLLKLTVTGPTRHAALVRARAAVEELVIEGVATNRAAVIALLGDEAYWRGEIDNTTLERLL